MKQKNKGTVLTSNMKEPWHSKQRARDFFPAPRMLVLSFRFIAGVGVRHGLLQNLPPQLAYIRVSSSS